MISLSYNLKTIQFFAIFFTFFWKKIDSLFLITNTTFVYQLINCFSGSKKEIKCLRKKKFSFCWNENYLLKKCWINIWWGSGRLFEAVFKFSFIRIWYLFYYQCAHHHFRFMKAPRKYQKWNSKARKMTTSTLSRTIDRLPPAEPGEELWKIGGNSKEESLLRKPLKKETRGMRFWTKTCSRKRKYGMCCLWMRRKVLVAAKRIPFQSLLTLG